MAIFNVPRAGRKNENYTENLIQNMFYDDNCVFKQGFGVIDNSAEEVIYSFDFVRNSVGKNNVLKTHYFELFIEYEIGMCTAMMIAEKIGRELYNAGFQCFVTVTDLGDRYLIAVAVNSVSFKNGYLFQDNNDCYANVFQFVSSLLPDCIDIQVSENTFFDPAKQDGNYCHGEYA